MILVDIPAKAKKSKNGNYYILKREAEMPGFENEKGMVYIGAPCNEEGKMDILHFQSEYHRYIRPKQSDNGKRSMRVAIPFLCERYLRENGALDILNDIYGKDLASILGRTNR